MSLVARPLIPAYAFNSPREPIRLYDGPIGGFNDGPVDGSIEFKLAPGPRVSWRVNSDHRLSFDFNDLELDIEHSTGRAQMVAHRGSATDGWLDPVTLGRAEAELSHVLVHWMNLPAIRSPHGIENPDGTVEYSGRWTAVLGDWSVRLDRRSDHTETWREIRAEGSIAMTHVMEIRRTAGDSFTPADVEPILSALHVGMSFALGRWIAPALPVGFDARGHRVWEQWGARHCSPGVPGALRWWHDQREWELEELLSRTVERFCDSQQEFTIRFLMSSAILSAAGGFVEQRIMTASAAIEHLTWVRLILDDGMSKKEYKKLQADGRLAQLVAEAGIEHAIDEEILPALHSYSLTADDGPLNGPLAVVRIRNALVHPTWHQDEVYRHAGLIQEAWFLTQHYLVLLILHHVGYTGSYQPMLRPGGWAGDVERVPWETEAVHTSEA